MKLLKTFWTFSRPHTIIGTTLSAVSLYIIAAAEYGFSELKVIHLVFALLSTWAGNIYIVGLNQLEDIEIDRINKPYLPLASGEFSLKTGKFIIIISGAIALLISATQGIYLFLVIPLSLLIGTAYSLPPLRLKRYPFRAAFSILVVRGIIVNLGLYLYYASAGDRIISIPNHIWALTSFFVLFGIAIALLKDVPDIKGDRVFKINTFAMRMGSQTIFNISLIILFSAYLTLIWTALFFLNNLNTSLVILCHCILILILWSRQRKMKVEVKSSMISFYMFVWKLFFIEYIIFPIFCWLNPTF